MCGIFGVYNHKDASKLTYFGLYALQHRGQESCGIVTFDGENSYQHKAVGLVPEIFDERRLDKLKGHIAVGHVRYSTVGSPTLTNTLPLRVYYRDKRIAIVQNGHVSNAKELRTELENSGTVFQTTNDGEIILQLVLRNIDKGINKAILTAMDKIKGSYSVILMINDRFIVFRDPHGYRPMCVGKLNGSYAVSSETCAFDLIGAEYLHDVPPGFIMEFKEGGPITLASKHRGRTANCIFELIYFARPDSYVYGKEVYSFRKWQGIYMHRRHPLKADLVMPFPDSGMYAAIGYSQESGIPLEMGMIRNHYVGRTFINPTQKMRDFNVKVKLNPVKSVIKGKDIIIIEDSIVRGTTAKSRVETLREFGANKIYMLVSCPPHKHQCHFGIDFTSKELIAASKTVEEIKEFIGVDYLGYSTIEDQVWASKTARIMTCFACFNGEYPSPICESFEKHCLEK